MVCSMWQVSETISLDPSPNTHKVSIAQRRPERLVVAWLLFKYVQRDSNDDVLLKATLATDCDAFLVHAQL